jgi:hypothetical protein
LAAARIELVEDCLPSGADDLLLFIKVFECFSRRFDVPRRLDLGGAQFFKALPDLAPEDGLCGLVPGV